MPYTATGAQPYIITTGATESALSVNLVKSWVKAPGAADDALLQLIIDRVADQAEKYTKRDFIKKTFKTFRDTFGDFNDDPAYLGYPSMSYGALSMPITLRRSPLIGVNSVKYYDLNNVQQTMDPSLYYTVVKDAFSMIASVDNNPWPSTADRYQAIEISFDAGYGAKEKDIPAALRSAMLAHIAAVYTNRGDVDVGNDADIYSLAPAASLSAYNQYRIYDFVA